MVEDAKTSTRGVNSKREQMFENTVGSRGTSPHSDTLILYRGRCAARGVLAAEGGNGRLDVEDVLTCGTCGVWTLLLGIVSSSESDMK